MLNSGRDDGNTAVPPLAEITFPRSYVLIFGRVKSVDFLGSALESAGTMTATLSLKEMTRREKLTVMESLWEDLSRTPEKLRSPAWHKDVLDERRARVQTGKATFTDWEVAKAELRRRAK